MARSRKQIAAARIGNFGRIRCGLTPLLLWTVIACPTWSQSPQDGAPSPGDQLAKPVLKRANLPEFINEQIRQLGAAAYRERELARWRLEQNPHATLQAIAEAIDEADHNTGSQLVDILGLLATHADITVSRKARELLDLTASGVGYASRQAANTVQAIAEVQESQAIQNLALHGAAVHQRDIRLHNASRIMRVTRPVVLEINSQFDGDREAIQWIRYLKSVDTVYISDAHISDELMAELSRLTQLKNIKLRYVTFELSSLKLLRSLTQLEYLEFSYTKIDDSALDLIATLPVSQYLRLYGTQVTPEGADRLAQQLDSVEIYCGRGGFLGVGTRVDNTRVTVVVPGSGAQLAGIRMGDKLTRIGDTTIEDFEDLRGQLGNFDVDEVVLISFERTQRDGTVEAFTVPVTLGEEPASESSR